MVFLPLFHPSFRALWVVPDGSAGFWKPLVLFAAQPVPHLSWPLSNQCLCLSLKVLYKLSRDTGAPLDRAVTVTPLISKPAIFSEPTSSQARSGQVKRRRCSGGFFPLSSSCFLSQEGRNPLKPDFTHQPSWNVCLAWGRSTNTPSSWGH